MNKSQSVLLAIVPLICVGLGMGLIGSSLTAMVAANETERVAAENMIVINKLRGDILLLETQVADCAKRADLYQESAIVLAQETSAWVNNIFGHELDLGYAMSLADEAEAHACVTPEP